MAHAQSRACLDGARCGLGGAGTAGPVEGCPGPGGGACPDRPAGRGGAQLAGRAQPVRPPRGRPEAIVNPLNSQMGQWTNAYSQFRMPMLWQVAIEGNEKHAECDNAMEQIYRREHAGPADDLHRPQGHADLTVHHPDLDCYSWRAVGRTRE